MYNQPEAILEQYDLEVSQITKGRGAYICETDKGIKMLREFRGSEERAEFLSGFLKQVKEHGMDVEQVLPKKEGGILVQDENGIRYWLKDMYQGNECSTHSGAEMEAALQLLAHFHKISEALSFEVPDFFKTGKNELLELYEKHNRELIKVKNYVRSRKKKNEFEMKFQDNYAHFMENALQTTELIRRQGNGEEGMLLVHGEFNQHNVLKTDREWMIVNFEWANYNIAVSDLANFLRKMMEKNNWDEELGRKLLKSYEDIRQLTENEEKQLYLALAYPEKFWKLANHYFNSHKAWLSARDIEKLDKVLEQEDARMTFLENLFSFIRE